MSKLAAVLFVLAMLALNFWATANPQPEPLPGGDPPVVYILNNNTKKFHYPDCASVGDIAPKNYEEFVGYRDVLIEMGYQPCKRCKP